MSIDGQTRNYDQMYEWSVEIDGLSVAWFTKCSSLEAEVDIVEQHEGGSITAADKSAGKVKFPEVTLSIGVTDNRELYEWFLSVVDAAANRGGVNGNYKKNLAIVQRDRDQSERRRYNLKKAWPCKYKFGEWDANSSENVTEEITLCYISNERVR